MTDKPTSLRAHIQQALTEDASLDSMRQLIADVFATDKATKVACPDCGTEFRPRLPDVRAQLQAVVELLEQVDGKAASAPTPDVTVVIERFSRE